MTEQGGVAGGEVLGGPHAPRSERDARWLATWQRWATPLIVLAAILPLVGQFTDDPAGDVAAEGFDTFTGSLWWAVAAPCASRIVRWVIQARSAKIAPRTRATIPKIIIISAWLAIASASGVPPSPTP